MFLLVNKPSGPTSHDIINLLRKITGEKKIGHAGTLDPFASGLLIVAIGRGSTKNISDFVHLDKEYIATLKLGQISDTYDRTGKITDSNKQQFNFNQKQIKEVLKKFIGSQQQLPPMFSAKKVNGQKLYNLARKGIEVARKPNTVNIKNIKLLDWSAESGILKIVVNCSSGTYIRSLASDIGERLGCGAFLKELVRTKIGEYKIEDAVNLQDLNKENYQQFCFNK